MTSKQAAKTPLYKDLAPNQRYAAYIRYAGARVVGQGQTNRREEALILRIALSCGDAWAQRTAQALGWTAKAA